jgi:hypothetical protein
MCPFLLGHNRRTGKIEALLMETPFALKYKVVQKLFFVRDVTLS